MANTRRHTNIERMLLDKLVSYRKQYDEIGGDYYNLPLTADEFDMLIANFKDSIRNYENRKRDNGKTE